MISTPAEPNTSPAAGRGGLSFRNERSARFQRRLAIFVVVAPIAGVVAAAVDHWNGGVGEVDLALLGVLYLGTAIGVEIGFHRFFTHRSFETGPVLKVILAVLGSMAAQGPLITWVAVHRRHHVSSDEDGDPHSPRPSGDGPLAWLRGLWHAHVGWMFLYQIPLTDLLRHAPDLVRDRTLYRIHRAYFVWPLLGLAIPAAVGGLSAGSVSGAVSGLIWGGFVRIFLVHHSTWIVNSVCHAIGSRPFEGVGASTNNAWLALPTWGASWHNNHHAYPRAACNSVRWWQVDLFGYLIHALGQLGLARNVRRRPAGHRSRIERDTT